MATSAKKIPVPRQDDPLDWLCLIRSENIGPMTFYQLMRRFGSATEALRGINDLAQSAGRNKPLKIFPHEKAEQEWLAIQRFGAKLLIASDPAYPPLLKAVSDAPPVLCTYGNQDLLHKKCLAIIGARNSSLHGKNFAKKVAHDLGQEEWIIASGLARGIDTSAHQGSLATGTIAVIAGGIDNIYPPENTSLYQEIAEQGVIVSESPFGVKPLSTFFPRRNRIISGLARGTIVVEAAQRSGSLTTARNALDQGRDVFAVPGSPLDPRCRGSNNLIRQGATLIQSADDVLETYNNLVPFHSDLAKEEPSNQIPVIKENSKIREKILENLSPTPINIDAIARQCEDSLDEILSAILELELAGLVTRHPGNKVARAVNG